MKFKQVIVVRKDLKISCGKLAVQVAHASLESAEVARRKFPDIFKKWRDEGGKKVVVYVGSEQELISVYNKASDLGLPTVLIRDAGLTELEPGTPTAVGIGPYEDKEIDKITGELRLFK